MVKAFALTILILLFGCDGRIIDGRIIEFSCHDNNLLGKMAEVRVVYRDRVDCINIIIEKSTKIQVHDDVTGILVECRQRQYFNKFIGPNENLLELMERSPVP